MMRKGLLALAIAAFAVCAPAHAQQAAPPAPYGAPIQLAPAETAMQAAVAEAERNNWRVAIAIVDSGGHLVSFRRMDGVGTAIVDIAIGKARTASSLREPSANLEGWAASSSAPVAIPGIMPFRGGVPIVVGGRIVGGIGVSGVTGEQDEQVANAGAGALR
jgi:glc operon protein GlcG